MIGITTYLKNIDRLPIIKRSFDSLIKTIDIDNIIVTDDCSPFKDGVEYIRSLGIRVIERPYNGGYAKAKNTLIRCFMELGEDIRFLADDDNLYEEGREEQYLEAINQTGWDHWNLRLSYLTLDNSQQPYGDPRSHLGYDYRQTPLVNGCFMSVSKDMINKIGYFNEMPCKNGHEHSIFTQRAIANGFAPTYIDVLEPKINNLQLLDKNYVVSTEDAYDIESLKKNGEMFNIDKKQFYPFHD